MKTYNKLDQLTALRFFAALMIVIHHTTGLFGIKNIGVNWGQGVSFFFVLSGFILLYVYPELKTFPEIIKFWRARFARIWPAYIGSLILGFFFVHYAWNTKTAIANILMVQAWFPLSSYYFSYNAVAWSISTEVFFYLAFPLLLYKWNRYWPIKFLLTGMVLIAILYLSNYFQLPDYGNPSVGSDGLMITQHGLIYISPLSRIFEFVLGMVVATLWLKKKWTHPAAWATCYEIAALFVCAASMYYSYRIVQLGKASFLGDAAAQWLTHCSSLFAFGLLIYIMAQGCGKISKILATPFLVLLGEISFSIYLLHQIILTVYARHIPALSFLQNSIALLVFMGILMLSSYLMWVCIEMPGRQFLLGKRKIHGTSTMQASWHDHRPTGKKTIIAGIALLCLFLFTCAAKRYFLSDL